MLLTAPRSPSAPPTFSSITMALSDPISNRDMLEPIVVCHIRRCDTLRSISLRRCRRFQSHSLFFESSVTESDLHRSKTRRGYEPTFAGTLPRWILITPPRITGSESKLGRFETLAEPFPWIQVSSSNSTSCVLHQSGRS